ncbi:MULTISPECIES: MrcB family domain-containing protein [Deefgea]|uniref:DUF3578 domain-containing protein n=1 Tax=Deefgea chitinilytica TaxID=570276 RepID=A0ABS2CCN5_9NEIS|nr:MULTISPECIES: DUF3578 domain-containing protein [Deefgea]MBM5571895.1 DUF3578 domain-containing protein [Deefgea chitinilytica]MBM9889130.1 DUF3578 domain-containing protein [Deefgea sp. CFH1-16]
MLREKLNKVLNELVTEKQKPFSSNQLAEFIRKDLQATVALIANKTNSTLQIKASAGAGNWADVPWVSILNPIITKSTQDGIYPVYLFCADGSGVFLSLNQGTTAPTQRLGRKAAEQYAANVIQTTLQKLKILPTWLQGEINLKTRTGLGLSYQSPNIAARFYPKDQLPSNEQLIEDLNEILSAYELIANEWSSGGYQSQDLLDPIEIDTAKVNAAIPLPKPFLLLAGISGTGKTRFVRQQAERSAMEGIRNFELIPIRPDWHEPSDLLGYVSRISGTQFITTPFLQFMAAAWRDAVVLGAGYSLKNPNEMTPFWACLDEMNLAPVEQYFADYLSVLETREWRDGNYSSASIFAPGKLFKATDTTVLAQLRIDLGFSDADWDGLWSYFLDQGMPLPPNLIVAGTVNMDETTHGFSRKVIDRAFTIDFGEFFPNVYDLFFEPKLEPVTLGFPLDSQITNADELADVAADPKGQRSIEFLQAVNELLKGTPFELAFRALNELLVMLKCFSPQTPEQLYAVWDDFLMAKLLPRLEGDEDKLQANGDDSLLIKLKTALTTRFLTAASRPDLFNIQISDKAAPAIAFRSLKKLEWMQDRLQRDRFTSFWP